MASWKKAISFGLMIWLIPFIVAFIAFPLKQSWRSLFESVMALTLSIVVVACAVRYFSRLKSASLGEGIRLGILWFAISVVIDLPLMLPPPINYTLVEYAADIGLTYLMMPTITIMSFPILGWINPGSAQSVHLISLTRLVRHTKSRL